VVARLLAQYWIDHKIAFAALDGDASHGALLRYYAQYSQPVDLTSEEGTDRIMERALEGEDRVLVDLPAQCAAALGRWLEHGDVLELARESDAPVTFWHVTDGGFDSVQLLAQLIARHAKQAKYVVVRNHGRARDFSQLAESETLARVQAVEGRVIDIPELHSAAMYRMDRHGSSYWAAVHDSESELKLPIMDRRRARKWLQECYRALEDVGDLL
jgi:hypothetical protein